MKKVRILIFLLCICLTLTACGKNKTVRAVEAAIDSIGEVTLDSGDAIQSAEKLLSILTDNEKEKVDNRVILVEAREEYDKLVLDALTAQQKLDTINQHREQKIQEAISFVLPGGYDFMVEDYEDVTGIVSNVYQGTQGYAVVVNPSGFNGSLTMMVGINTNCEVLGISIISHTETAGLGSVAAANTSVGETFRNQFIGKSISVAVSQDGGEVDAIAGATITSRAVCEGVNAALLCVAGLI